MSEFPYGMFWNQSFTWCIIFNKLIVSNSSIRYTRHPVHTSYWHYDYYITLSSAPNKHMYMHTLNQT